MRYITEEAFRILQIEITDDKREIKKAYARMVKQYHPEEFPDEWAQIRDAYESAVLYAERREKVRDMDKDRVERMQFEPVKSEKTDTSETTQHLIPIEIPSVPIAEKDEVDDIFEHLDELARVQAKQIRDMKLKDSLKQLGRMKSVQDVGTWENFFQNQDLEVMATDTFLNKWGEVLSIIKIDNAVYWLCIVQLRRIREYCEQSGSEHEKTGIPMSIEYVRTKLRHSRRKKGFTLPLVLLVCAVLFILCRPEVWRTDDSPKIPSSISGDSVLTYLKEEMTKDKENSEALEGTGYTEEDLLKAVEEQQKLLYRFHINNKEKMISEQNVKRIETGIPIQTGVFLCGWEQNNSENKLEYENITDASEIGLIRGENLSEKNFLATNLWTKTENAVGTICFHPKSMGISENFKVYFSYGGGYVEVYNYNSKFSLSLNAFCFFEIGDYYVFPLMIPQRKENESVLVVIVEE